jgi:hypothetical protein
METSVIRKRLNTFKSGAGKLTRVSDDVVMEVLRSWEAWPGTTVDYQREIGLSKQQLAIMIKKGKKLVKSGVVTDGEFRQIEIAAPTGQAQEGLMTVKLNGGMAVSFFQVDHVVDFLRKMA